MYRKTRDQQAAYRRAMNDYRSKMAVRENEYLVKIEKKKGMRMAALYGVATTIVGIAMLGLLLALLGIERNTRTLENLIRKMDAQSTHPENK